MAIREDENLFTNENVPEEWGLNIEDAQGCPLPSKTKKHTHMGVFWLLEGRGCERRDERAPNGPICCVSSRRCKRTPKPYPKAGTVLVFQRWGRGEVRRGGSRHVKHAISACLTCLGWEGGCWTAQTCPFWRVCAVQGRVYHCGNEGGARQGGRGIETRQTRWYSYTVQGPVQGPDLYA